jgi:hypothetical protein
MKYLVFLILILCLAACDANVAPFPDRCRAVGVYVEDDDTVTGYIADIMSVKHIEEVRYQCQKPFGTDPWGCTIALNPGEYRIVYLSKGYDAKAHEQCHALYEEWRHID